MRGQGHVDLPPCGYTAMRLQDQAATRPCGYKTISVDLQPFAKEKSVINFIYVINHF